MKKKLAVVVGSLAAVYMFVPDPTDVVPILGWLDEGVAGAMLIWSLRTLGVTPGALFGKLSASTTTTATKATATEHRMTPV